MPDSAATREYRNTPVPQAGTPWREAEFSVVDLELTGLDPEVNEIVSFATVTVARGRIRLDDARYGTVRPRRMPEPDTIRIHGLREDDLADSPPLAQALDEILEAITGRVLVAHVAAIDSGFLRTALRRQRLDLKNPVVDTAGMALELRRLRRESPFRRGGESGSRSAVSSPGLSDLAGSLGLPVHRPHHADGDALTAAQVFLALATHLEAFDHPLTVGTLQRISERGDQSPAPGVFRRLVRRLGL